MNDLFFENDDLNLYVLVTMTNWDEAPRIRHEVAKFLSVRNNVLFIQIYSQRGRFRKVQKLHPRIIIEKAGFSLPGLTRLFWVVPFFRKIYHWYLSICISRVVKKYTNKKFLLVSFQYDFPEVFSIDDVFAGVYFCNDDFVGQGYKQSEFVKNIKYKTQGQVVRNADLVVTVSDPLQELLSKYSNDVKLIYSGHGFDLNRSLDFYNKKTIKKDDINVCYLGFLNSGVAVEWLYYIATQDDINLTIVGPLSKSVLEAFGNKKNFKHIDILVNEPLQDFLLSQDVLLMPYSSSVANNMTSTPAKLFQYISSGKPIVSSIMPNLIRLPDKFVYMAKDKYEFYSLVKKSIEENCKELALERIEFAKKHTWSARGEEFDRLVNAVLVRSDRNENA
ncbi:MULTISPECIES: hypothetical protein [Comamonas]|uniref:hypothetical protein n=1 Tax=Comamonas TaxID=283 RepID=UPI00257D2F8C|nr:MULTISPECIES: hypothetical protein [Comamonas]